MKIIIETPHIKPGESLLEFVRDRVEKLNVLSDRLQEARVTLKLGKSDIRENKICEIRGIISGDNLFVEKQANTFKEASIKAVDAIKRKITDLKER